MSVLLRCVFLILSTFQFSEAIDDTDYPDEISSLSNQSLLTHEIENLRRDGVWEAMLHLAWSDYINKINKDRELYGVSMDPLQLSPILGQNIHIQRNIIGYEVDLKFWDLWVHGITNMQLRNVSILRDNGLSTVLTSAVLYTPVLELEGYYSMEGSGSGAWSWISASKLSSQGEQKFSINMQNVSLGVELQVNLVTLCDLSRSEMSSAITNINLPLNYGHVDINFDNIGNVLGTVVPLLGSIAINTQKKALVSIIRDQIVREAPGLICSKFEIMDKEPEEATRHFDRVWNKLLARENKDLYRDRVAEETVKLVFNQSILTHLNNVTSPLRKKVDPLVLFPLEFQFWNHLFKSNVRVCDVYLHNLKKMSNMDMLLVRDKSLNFSALRVSVKLPITWMTGQYKLANSYFLKYFPANAGGDFNVVMKHMFAKMIVVLRNTEQGLVLEHFSTDANWRRTSFLFDGLWNGLGEFADMIMNELGVGGIIVKKEKKKILEEVKVTMRGLAVCMLWHPSQGLELCMRQFWIDLGWTYPWEYPTCD